MQWREFGGVRIGLNHSTDIINHVELPVAEAEEARRFYEAVLAPLGLTLIISIDPARTAHGGARHGFGKNGYPSLWIHQESGKSARSISPSPLMTGQQSMRFMTPRWPMAERTMAGRASAMRYHENYYAAYVLDPDDNNIEAVCQRD